MHPRVPEAVTAMTFSASSAASRQRIAARMLQLVRSERHRRLRLSSETGDPRPQCWLLKDHALC
jgi:hypothetical protein